MVDGLHYFGELEGQQAYVGIPTYSEVELAATSESRRLAIPLAATLYGKQHVTMIQLDDVSMPEKTHDGRFMFLAVWRELVAYPLHAHETETTFSFRVYVRTCRISVDRNGALDRISFSDARVGIEDATLINPPDEV